MIKLGMCSITLGKLSAEEVISAVKKSGLTAIEWWGKAHVPCGDITRASEVGELTRAAGLEISSYGSYYKVGVGNDFDDVLATAKALQAPTIRVWAGECNYEDASEEQINTIVADSLRIADLAAKENISITFESHQKTLTNGMKSTELFLAKVVHDNIFFSWQKVHGTTVEYSCDMIKMIAPRLSTVHLYHWLLPDPTKFAERRPFIEGREDWVKYFEIIKSLGDHYVLMEFTCDDTVEQFFADAEVMKSL